jgi:type I restriction enzyme S subunit
VGFTPNDRTNSAYIRVLLTSFRPILERSAPQVAQKNINLKILRELPVPVPPKEIQDEFMIQHDGLLALDEIRLKSGQYLDKLWIGLLHRAFSGDLTVKWREAHVKELLTEMAEQTKILRASSEAN